MVVCVFQGIFPFYLFKKMYWHKIVLNIFIVILQCVRNEVLFLISFWILVILYFFCLKFSAITSFHLIDFKIVFFP